MTEAASLSAYELQRLDNIRRNHEQLKALGLDAQGGVVPGKVRVQPAPKRRKVEPKVERVPERRSERARGAKAPDFYIASESAGGDVKVGGDTAALAKARAAAAKVAAEAADPLTKFGLGGLPEGETDLLEGEQAAFKALYETKRAKAQELQIEGYKIAQHRSLCEMVRQLPSTLDELRACWGWGGSGVRLEKYGELFLGVLRPHVSAVEAAHAAATAEYEAKVAARGSEDGGEEGGDGDDVAAEAVAAQVAAARLRDSQRRRDEARVEGAPMPEKPGDLLDGERAAFDALIAASHVRAEEIGERYVWNIAMARSLCEMVRRVPTSDEELRGCWGFGGAGVRAERHGAFLLAALKPHVASLRALHGDGDGAAAPQAEEEKAVAEVKEEEREERGAASVPPRRPSARVSRAEEEPPSGHTTRATSAKAAAKRKARV
jgi:hypothetical protein